MKILACSVTNAPPDVLEAHLQTVDWQQLPPEVEIVRAYVADVEDCSDASIAVLKRFCDAVILSDPKPEGAAYAVTDRTHEWQIPTFHWLAQQKQKLLDFAAEQRFDAVWLVDSDLLLGPDTLTSLIACEKPIVSAVFWTRWVPDAPPQPQVWLTHPYGLSGQGMQEHEFLDKLMKKQLVQVRGLGACTLIRAEALTKVAFWPLVEGLPQEGMWQGEDRHFCVRAQRAHVELWADAWPDIFHVYRPADRARIPEALEALRAAVPGALRSFTIEPCEEPALVGWKEHVRGANVELLPDLQLALDSLASGEECLVSAAFPPWHPIAQYRGQSKVFRLKMLGSKELRGVLCA